MKKLLALFLCCLMAFSTLGAAALTLTGVEQSAEIIPIAAADETTLAGATTITYAVVNKTVPVDVSDGQTVAYLPIMTGDYYIPGTLNADTGVISVHIGWATVENAAEPETTVVLNGENVTLYPVYQKMAQYDLVNGELIWFEDFSAESMTTATYSKDGIPAFTITSSYSTYSFEKTDKGISLKSTATDTSKGRVDFILSLENFTLEDGKYNLFFDSYLSKSVTYMSWFRVKSIVDAGDTKSLGYNYGISGGSPNSWVTIQSPTHNLLNGSTYRDVVQGDIWNNWQVQSTEVANLYAYFDNLRIYHKAPDTSYVVYVDEDGSILASAIAADGVVPGSDIAYLEYWSDANGNRFVPGAAVTKAELAGKTLTAHIAVPTTTVNVYYFGINKPDSVDVPVGQTVEYSPKMTAGEYYIPGTLDEDTGIISVHIGWATEENADQPIDTVELTENDVTLYPVYQKMAQYDLDNGELIWFDEFSSGDLKVPSYSKDSNVTSSIESIGTGATQFTLSCEKTSEKGVSLKSTPISNPSKGRVGFGVYFTNFTLEAGKYNLFFDSYYHEANSPAKPFNYVSASFDGIGSKFTTIKPYPKESWKTNQISTEDVTNPVNSKLWQVFSEVSDNGTTGKGNYAYFDNLRIYHKAPDTSYVVYADADGSILASAIAADGVVPGSDIDGFVCWRDASGNKFFPGDAVTAAELAGKTLTAYVQEWKNAMGFAYEGNQNAYGADRTPLPTRGCTAYTEIMDDEGRTVLHVHAGGSTSGEAGFIMHLNNSFGYIASNRIDGTEYNLLKMTLKAQDWKTSETAEPATKQIRMYYYNGANTGDVQFFSGLNPNYSTGLTVTPGAYQTFEADLRKVGGWVNNTDIGGFRFDTTYFASEKIYSADTYLDSLRVYRSGILTVNYDTNAPDGATVIHNVAPDTNRGVGSGYYLTDEHPEAEGYTFLGWALTPDAAADDVVTTVDLERDMTVYAVWGTSSTPVNMEEYSLRSDGTPGIRFSSFISDTQREAASEYGFIVALASSFPGGNYSGLVFPEDLKKKGTARAKDETGKDTTAGGVRFLYATSYNKATGLNLGNPGVTFGGLDGFKINALLVNIAGTDENTEFAVRAYIKIGDRYYYGKTMVKSRSDIQG